MLALADATFLLLHTALILFNVLGWVVPAWRRANLVMLLLTAASWFGLGLFYGLGYCPLTDWHWQVLRAMGRTDLPRSYVQYLVTRLTGLVPDSGLVDTAVGVGFALALVVSAGLSIRDWRRSHRQVDTPHVPPAPER